MRNFTYVITILSLAFLVGSCSAPGKHGIKPYPEYSGVDPRVQAEVDEFFALSARHNLTFKGFVTVGIKEINNGNVIGTCTRTYYFREIDLDLNFLMEASPERRKMLIFHEMIHCYCTRGHDYEGVEYPTDLTRLFDFIRVKAQQAIPWCLAKAVPGYLDDGCPATIMHPYIVTQSCIEKHHDHYVNEMFSGCKPY